MAKKTQRWNLRVKGPRGSGPGEVTRTFEELIELLDRVHRAHSGDGVRVTGIRMKGGEA